MVVRNVFKKLLGTILAASPFFRASPPTPAPTVVTTVTIVPVEKVSVERFELPDFEFNEPSEDVLSPENILLPFSPSPSLSFEYTLDDIVSAAVDTSSASDTSSDTLVPNTPSLPFDFAFLRELGRGGSGEVYHVKDKVIGKHFALKVAKKGKKNGLNRPSLIIDELKTLRRMNGSEWTVGVEAAWNDSQNWYFVLPYMSGGDALSELRNADGVFSEAKAKFIFAQMVCALTFVHRQGIIHGDVKLENILRTCDGQYKLADFGLATRFEELPSEDERTHQPYFPWRVEDFDGFKLGDRQPPRRPVSQLTFVQNVFKGTPEYMAPEICQGRLHSFPVDFWALAVALYVMTTGDFPWVQEEDEEVQHLLKKIVKADLTFYPEDEVSEEGVDFMGWMLEKKPEKRLHIFDIPDHPYLKDLPWEMIEDQTYEVFIHSHMEGDEEVEAEYDEYVIPFVVGHDADGVEVGFEYCSEELESAFDDVFSLLST